MKGEAELGGVGEMDKKKKDMNEGEKKKVQWVFRADREGIGALMGTCT